MGLRLAVSASLAAALLTSVGSLLTEMGAAAEPTRRAAKARPPAQAQRVNAAEPSVRDDADLTVALPPNFPDLARQSGEPQIPGLAIVYLHALGDPAQANKWQNIIAHQTEGPAGAARASAQAQGANPSKRGVMIWVETDGTVYWSTAETAITTHGDVANRNDNKYIDNSKTYRSVIKTNSIGVEFAGNYPDVAKPVTRDQVRTWLILVRFLQERYGIAAENIYAHNWIDYKDARYCEGCELAILARKLAYEPSKRP
jgi:hypothetical protein